MKLSDSSKNSAVKEELKKPSKKETGNSGEQKACDYLVSKGFEILFKNWRTRRGEIDIIFLDGDVLVFAEVKTLPNGNAEILSHVLNEGKRKRIIETTKRFLEKYRQYNNRKIRFDVLAIDMPEFGPVYHIADAFSEYV